MRLLYLFSSSPSSSSLSGQYCPLMRARAGGPKRMNIFGTVAARTKAMHKSCNVRAQIKISARVSICEHYLLFRLERLRLRRPGKLSRAANPPLAYLTRAPIHSLIIIIIIIIFSSSSSSFWIQLFDNTTGQTKLSHSRLIVNKCARARVSIQH